MELFQCPELIRQPPAPAAQKTQGEFLLKLGLEARRDRLCEKATPEQQERILASAIRLSDPEAMGLLFKTLAITSPGLAAPAPFVEA